MSELVLVTYATRYGSTQEVAKTIADSLRHNGYEVDLLSVGDVKNLDKYRAVVIGAPIYIGKWHHEAHLFLSQHHAELVEHPLAIFALGPLGTDEAEMQESRRQLDEDLLRYPWLKPVALAMFVGKYDKAKLNLAHRAVAALPASPLHGRPTSDNRDWETIRAWAEDLPAKLQRNVNVHC